MLVQGKEAGCITVVSERQSEFVTSGFCQYVKVISFIPNAYDNSAAATGRFYAACVHWVKLPCAAAVIKLLLDAVGPKLFAAINRNMSSRIRLKLLFFKVLCL